MSSKTLKPIAITLFFSFILLSKTYAQQSSREIADNSGYPGKEKATEEYFVFNGNGLENIDKKIESIDISIVKNHKLGDEVAKRLHLIENSYTYYSKSPGAISSKKIIQKPIIYNSIYKIEKYYRRKVRKASLERGKAIDELSQYLESTLLLLYKDTQEFEEELNRTDSEENMIAVFERVKIK